MDAQLNEDREPIRLHLTRQEWKACTEFDEPDSEPLERAVAAHLRGEFMWMSRVRPEGQGIETYKHRDTRRYLHLDHAGQAWEWQTDGSWVRTTVDAAVRQAIAEPTVTRTSGLDPRGRKSPPVGPGGAQESAPIRVETPSACQEGMEATAVRMSTASRLVQLMAIVFWSACWAALHRSYSASAAA